MSQVPTLNGGGLSSSGLHKDNSGSGGRLAVVFVVLSLVMFTMSARETNGGFFTTVKAVYSTVTTPVRYVGVVVTAPFQGLGNVFANLTASQKSLSELKAENEKLKARNAELEEAEKTSERLEDLRRGVRGLQAGGRGERTVTPDGGPKLDYEDVLDQEAAKRALVISAAGRHGLLMVGPPGAGKTMLARRLPTILPPLTPEEAEEVALIGSVAGLSGGGQDNGARPFRAPHHSISQAGMIGGGSPVRPGEVTLAHHGVLFLDELPEFSTNVLQSLRQPFEEHVVRLVRADGLYRFPCDFTFLAAANPCPCGYLGDPAHACTCAPAKVAQYQSRVGGPLKDRIDVHIFVSRPDSRKVVEGTRGMSSAQMRDLVLGAREFRAWRESGLGHEGEEGLESMVLGEEAASVLESMARSLGFGGRSIVRVAKVARTIADIRQGEAVSKEDVLEACAYRDRRG